MMRHLVALVFAAIGFGVHAAPASPESVETLLVEMHTQSTLDSIYAPVEQMMRRAASQSPGTTPEQKQAFEAKLPRIMALMRDEMNWDRMKPRYVQLYCETFEQDEVDGLIAFYATPTGQAFVNKMPVVMQKSLSISQSMMQSLMPRMIALMREPEPDASSPR